MDNVIAELVSSGKRSFDAFSGNPYFAMAESSAHRHWAYYFAPLAHSFDYTSVLELACGHGRNTEILARISENVICVDPLQECIDQCKARFSKKSNVTPILTNGVDLSPIKSDSQTLVYSFDSMVHFEPEIVENYVSEVARILKSGGKAFLHVSNWTGGFGQDFMTQPHWRNYMSRDIFQYFAHKYQLTVTNSRIVSWDESLGQIDSLVSDLDGIYVLMK